MKNGYLFFLILLGFHVQSLGQSPQAFKYQAIARDINGDILMNQSVTFRLSIRQSSPSGTIVYQEIHPILTNDHGLANLEIGNGIPSLGAFNSIYWDLYDHYLTVELDPAGGTSYQNMGTSQLLSVPYAMFAEKNPHWGINGSNIYFKMSGNVGIGSYNPDTRLEVRKDFSTTNNVEDVVEILRGTTGTVQSGIGAGLIFRNEVSNSAYALSGRIASVMENATSGSSSSGMLFQTRPAGGIMNEALYIDPDGKIGVGDTDPNAQLDIDGDLRVDYPGPTNGFMVYGSPSNTYALAYIQNANPGSGYGISAGMSNTSAAFNSYGLAGWNYGAGYGVYGKNTNNGTGTHGINTLSNNYGSLGDPSYGVYGRNNSGNYGYFGGSSYGAYGRNNNGNYGYFGGEDYAIYAYLSTINPGNYAIFGYGTHGSTSIGTGYGVYNTIGGVRGYNYWGNSYTFSVAGYSYLDYGRSGECFGSNDPGTNWGSLAYRNSSGNIYGGYFTTYTSGSGKDAEVMVNNGVGVWGDLFGADIHGKVYGAFIEGENYAIYSKGNSFHNGLDVHLQDNGNNAQTVLYTSVSTDATIQTSGYANISGGKAKIGFSKAFSDAVSENEPIIVTVTPMGNSNGFFLTGVDLNGFLVTENNDGKSNVPVSYIAIGKRKGYENPQLPQEVIASDYIAKLAQGLHNDNDMETDGAGLYYENGQLIVGKHPSSFPDLNKKPVEQPEEQVPEIKIPENSNNGKAPEETKME